MANGVLYFTVGQRRNVIAANPGTGETLWTWRPDEGARFDQAPRKVGRGVAYWAEGNNDARIITVTPGFQLVALNAKTGVPIREFGNNGSVDLFKQLDLTTPLDPMGKIGNSSAPCLHRRLSSVALTRAAPAEQKRQRRRHGVRRPHRQEALDLPHDSALRRGRLRDVAERIGHVQRQRGRLGSLLGR
jgi:glucose dehydrogenase